MERWVSGLNQRFAKPPTAVKRSGSSNLPLSANCWYSSMVEPRSSKPLTRVRFPLPAPIAPLVYWLEHWSFKPGEADRYRYGVPITADSFNGRTRDFEARYEGSIPSSASSALLSAKAGLSYGPQVGSTPTCATIYAR